jgi:hypothetical protein
MAWPSNFKQPPGGLHEPWLTVWRAALAEIEKAAAWTPAVRPVLDEYVAALRTAAQLRDLADAADTVTAASHLRGDADRESRRALTYARQLGLVGRQGPKAPAPARRPRNDEVAARRGDPVSVVDELAVRRAAS